MKFITKDDFIDVLELSTRTNNCLRRAEVHTIGSLIEYAKSNDLSMIYGMGRLSVEEVERVLKELETGDNSKFILIDKGTLDIKEKTKCRSEKDENIRKENLLISAGDFDDEMKEKLCEKNIFLYTQLWDKSISEIYSLGIAKYKSMWDFFYKTLESRDLYDKATSEEAKFLLKNHKILNRIIEELVPYVNRNKNVAVLQLLHIFITNRYYEKTFLKSLIEYEPIKMFLNGKIIFFLKRNHYASKSEIFEIIPECLQKTEIMEDILKNMEQGKIICLEKGKICLYLPSFSEILDKIPKQRTKEIVRSRFSGKTLEDVAKEFDLTRERVRQIVSKVISGFPDVKENKYIYLYENYHINEDEFCEAFSEPVETYMYLKTICGVKNGDKKELDEEILFDENIPSQMKKMLEPVIYKDYVRIGATAIRKNRPELVKYVVKKYCKEQTRFDKFREIYMNFLKENGIDNETALWIEDRAYINQLSECNYVLWNQGKSFRYYDIAGQDYEDLFDTLDLEQYEDVELSTLKFINDYPKLMGRYDIHDEYEFHNLLKKIIPKENTYIKFGRMPTMEFGNPNTDNQVLEMLLQYAPISVKDFAKMYEKQYGVKAETVIGSYMKNFDDYFYDGIYTLSVDNLPHEEFEKMKELLTQDCYAILEVKQIYKSQFPYKSISAINPYTLKTLGFKVYTGYIIKNTYDSALSYFKHMLTKDDIIDIGNLNRHIRNCVTFISTLYDLCAKYEIIEFEPHKYINIRKLEEKGITKDTLKDYCNAVAEKVKPGEFFTVTSLRKDGFTHKIDDAGFGYWFYVSILAEDYEHFSCRRMGKTRLFYRGREKIRMSDMLSVLLSVRKYISLEELHRLLADYYNIHVNMYKIIEFMKETDLHYDPIDKRVYRDYETYEKMKS